MVAKVKLLNTVKELLLSIDSNYSMPFNALAILKLKLWQTLDVVLYLLLMLFSSLGVDVDPRMAAQYAIKGGFKGNQWWY